MKIIWASWTRGAFSAAAASLLIVASGNMAAATDDAPDSPHLTPFQWKKPVPIETDSADREIRKDRPALRKEPQQQSGQESDWVCETIFGPEQVCTRKSTGNGVMGVVGETELYDPKTGVINEGLLNAVESRDVGFQVPPLPQMKGPRKFPQKARAKSPPPDETPSASTAPASGRPEAAVPAATTPPANQEGDGFPGETPQLLR